MSERKNTAFLILIFFFSLYILTAKGFIKHFDGETMYQVTRSIVEEGRVSVEKEFAGRIMGSPGPDGNLYSKYEIGHSVAAVPLYLVGRAAAAVFPSLPRTLFTRFACSLLGQFATAAACVVIYLFCQDLGYGKRTSVLLALLYGLGTMAWPYSKTFFREPVSAFLILSGACCAYRYRLRGRLSTLFACGAFLGGALLERQDGALAIAVIGVYVACASPRAGRAARRFFSFLAPVAAAAAVNLAYNWARYGSIWITGYEGQDIDTGFSTPFFVGLYGLLLSSGKSVFIYSPVLVLFLPSIFFFFAAHRKEALLFVSLIAVYTCFYARWGYWHGGWCWGPRFMLQVIPFALIPVGSLLRRRNSAPVAAVLVMVIAASFAVQVLAVSVSEMRFLQATMVPWEADDPLFRPGRKVIHGDIIFDPAYFPLRAQWRSFLNCSWKKLSGDLSDPSVLEETSFRREIERGPDAWWAYLYRLGLPPLLLLSVVPLLVVCAVSFLFLVRRTR